MQKHLRRKKRQRKPQESLNRKSKRGLLPKKLSQKPKHVKRMRRS